jgi:hypothetical protein
MATMAVNFQSDIEHHLRHCLEVRKFTKSSSSNRFVAGINLPFLIEEELFSGLLEPTRPERGAIH